MKQEKNETLDALNIDYELPELPEEIRVLKPLVYVDGEDFCCLMGSDLMEGIFGCGRSPRLAMKDWVSNLKHRLKTDDPEDELAKYARKKINGRIDAHQV